MPLSYQITDPDVRLLASIASSLQGDYISVSDPWKDSPFAWIKALPSRQKGKVGEQLVAGWCAAKGLDVLSCHDQEADRIIQGRRIEIKFSTLWAGGFYTFQQFRDQNYDYAICLGLSPFEAHAWVISKAILRRHVIGHTPQHRGRAGTDTFWLQVTPPTPPSWLNRCGGTLSEAFKILKGIRAP